MKFKLAYKLFGAIFLILLIAVGAMELSRKWFGRNFRSYLQQERIERLKTVVPLLQASYRKHNGWEDVENNIGFWSRRLRRDYDLPGAPPPRDEARPIRPRPRGKGPPHRRPPFKRGGRFLLSDEKGHPIIGKPKPGDEPRLVAIQVNERIVGWLGLTKMEPIKKGPPAAFINQQLKFIYLIGAVVLTATIAIAFLLSRQLLRPIKRLTAGAQAITNRDFSIRIKEDSRDEFGLLAETFNDMAATLQKYEQMRRQWLSDISHELRTPLAVLRAEIESLLDGIRQPTMQNLRSLHAEIMHIGKLVEDLHLISIADSNALILNRQLFAPGDVLDNTVKAFHSRMTQKQIQLDLHHAQYKDIRVLGDADRIGQVFTNIFENACKYVQPPGRLSISAVVDDSFVSFYFKDSGPGVPDASLPRLFDRLYRVDPSRSRNQGGSGLGLSICKHIVKLHGGSIWAENNTDGGLTIVLQLPVAKA